VIYVTNQGVDHISGFRMSAKFLSAFLIISYSTKIVLVADLCFYLTDFLDKPDEKGSGIGLPVVELVKNSLTLPLQGQSLLNALESEHLHTSTLTF